MINIIPRPYKFSQDTGSFNMLKGFTIEYPDIWNKEVSRFVDFAHRVGLDATTDSLNSISFIVSEKLSREGYLIDIETNNMTITASTNAGCLYAIVSLSQLIVAHGGVIPCYKIEDKPRFNYRGFMLDVGRYFYSVDDIKKFLDIMSVHKLNYFHWHLTEDQGWRIEIKKYPKLTELGSSRTHTNFNTKEHHGFYTQDEIRDIVAYAHSLNIKVIPEIDMPGHMQAALHAYPELGCFDRELPVATHWGVKHDILCGGKITVRQFVKDVIDEVIELFPDKFIHIGGDEAVKMRWCMCKNCQESIKNLGLKDENELQAHFINDINAHIRSKGYTSIMWNEDTITHKINNNIVWMAWNIDENKKPAMLDELNAGRLIINASSSPNYLDLPHSINNLESIYKQDVNFVEPNNNMFGMEAPLWTEFVPNMKKAESLLFPRLGAFAEVAWSDEDNRDYDNLLKKMDSYYDYLGQLGIENMTPIDKANPKGISKTTSNIWWSRRMLTWHGLHNLIDDAKVKRLAKKKCPELFSKNKK